MQEWPVRATCDLSANRTRSKGLNSSGYQYQSLVVLDLVLLKSTTPHRLWPKVHKERVAVERGDGYPVSRQCYEALHKGSIQGRFLEGGQGKFTTEAYVGIYRVNQCTDIGCDGCQDNPKYS